MFSWFCNLFVAVSIFLSIWLFIKMLNTMMSKGWRATVASVLALVVCVAIWVFSVPVLMLPKTIGHLYVRSMEGTYALSGIIFIAVNVLLLWLLAICIMPVKAPGKNKGTIITGWTISFGKVKFCKGEAGKFQNFWHRLFSLENFISGLRICNFEVKGGSGASVKVKFVAIATEETEFGSFEREIRSYFYELQDRIGILLDDHKTEEEIARWLAVRVADYIKRGLDFQLQKLEYVPASNNLLPRYTQALHCLSKKGTGTATT